MNGNSDKNSSHSVSSFQRIAKVNKQELESKVNAIFQQQNTNYQRPFRNSQANKTHEYKKNKSQEFE